MKINLNEQYKYILIAEESFFDKKKRGNVEIKASQSMQGF